MNRFERVKSAAPLEAMPDRLRALAAMPWEGVPAGDLERLRVWGFTHRPKTPGKFMVRVRVPLGRLTADQGRTIAHLAETYGDPTLDLTTRAQIQLRGIAWPDVPEVLEQLDAANLSARQTLMDSVRAILTCPLAGLTKNEAFDATPVIQAVEREALSRPELLNLPRKINIAITGCRGDCCAAAWQDLALTPMTRVGVCGQVQQGFTVAVGGKLAGRTPRRAEPLDVFVSQEDALALVLAVLEIFRRHGHRKTRAKARLADLIDTWGLPRFRAALAAQLGRSLPRVAPKTTHGFKGAHSPFYTPRRQAAKPPRSEPRGLRRHQGLGQFIARERIGLHTQRKHPTSPCLPWRLGVKTTAPPPKPHLLAPKPPASTAPPRSATPPASPSASRPPSAASPPRNGAPSATTPTTSAAANSVSPPIKTSCSRI